MITLNSKYHIPNRWEELSPSQYQYVVGVVLEYLKGKFTAQEVRILTFCHLSGVNPRLVRARDRQLFDENMYRISRELGFMFRYEYPKDTLSELDVELQKVLEKVHPDDLPDSPEVAYARKKKPKIRPDFTFAKNLMPVLRLNQKERGRYKFELVNNVISTSLTAVQYVNANMLMAELISSQDLAYIDTLLAVLYCPLPYTEEKAMALREAVVKLEYEAKEAAFICFQAIQEFLANRTKYGLLWSRQQTKKGAKGKLSLGLADSIYSLAQTGYGSLSEVEAMPLTAFLDVQLKNIIDTVKLLHQHEKSKADISAETGLTLSQINSIL